jgi:hypothetical protein
MIIKTFKSPINADDGEKHHFIGHAECTMRLFAGPLSGQIVWDYTFIDGRHIGEKEQKIITLWFDHNHRLIDFNGVFELPDEAIELLEANGYNAQIAK